MQKLIERRESLLKECEGIAMRAKETGVALTADEHAKIAANFSEADALADTIRDIKRVDEATRSVAPPPSLVDGGGKSNCTTLRTADGQHVRCFAKGQRVADCGPGRHEGGLDLRGLGTALVASITGNSRGAESELRALSEGLNSGGGVFVPEQLSAELVDLARSKSVMMNAGARLVDMATESLRLVTVLSDPTIGRQGENQVIDSSDPAFSSLLFVAKKHGVLVKCSNELLADAPGAGEAVVNMLASAWAQYMDGLLIDHLLESEHIGATSSVGAITWDDLIDARKAVAGQNGLATHAIMHPDTTAALGKLKSAVELVYLNRPSILDDLTMLETTGIANTSALVGDFSQCVVAQRGNVAIELSREAGDAFAYDQTWIRLLWRGDVGTLRHKHIHELSGLTY